MDCPAIEANNDIQKLLERITSYQSRIFTLYHDSAYQINRCSHTNSKNGREMWHVSQEKLFDLVFKANSFQILLKQLIYCCVEQQAHATRCLYEPCHKQTFDNLEYNFDTFQKSFPGRLLEAQEEDAKLRKLQLEEKHNEKKNSISSELKTVQTELCVIKQREAILQAKQAALHQEEESEMSNFVETQDIILRDQEVQRSFNKVLIELAAAPPSDEQVQVTVAMEFMLNCEIAETVGPLSNLYSSCSEVSFLDEADETEAAEAEEAGSAEAAAAGQSSDIHMVLSIKDGQDQQICINQGSNQQLLGKFDSKYLEKAPPKACQERYSCCTCDHEFEKGERKKPSKLFAKKWRALAHAKDHLQPHQPCTLLMKNQRMCSVIFKTATQREGHLKRIHQSVACRICAVSCLMSEFDAHLRTVHASVLCRCKKKKKVKFQALDHQCF